MISKINYILTFIFICINVSAQSNLSGTVVDDKDNPVPHTSIIALSKSDSLFISGTTTDTNGKFHLCDIKDCILNVSCIGYESVFMDSWAGHRIIKITPNIIELNKVTVESSLPITRIENDALVTSIKGTILEKIGSAREVLERLPGVVTNSDRVTVLGKGTPAIYINGQLVRNHHLLDQLPSTKIKKVEIVTNPGARYNAEVSSVIRIYTERVPGEGLSVSEKATLNYRDFFCIVNQTDINYRHDKFDLFTTLEYNYSKMKGSSVNVQDSKFAQHYRQDVNIDSKSRQYLYDYKIGFNYSPSIKHAFGAFYQISHKPTRAKSLYDSKSWIDELLEENSIVEKNTKYQKTDHLIEGYYTGILGKWTFAANFDILWKSSSNEEYSDETYKISGFRKISINDDSNAHLYAGEAHFSHPLWRGRLNFGTEYTNSVRSETSVNKEQIISDNDDKVCEDNVAAYIETSQRLGVINLQVGVRYEHVDSKYYEKGGKISEQSRLYDNLFPSATIVFPIKKAVFQLSYSKKYDRPLYSQLSGTISYVNRYLYQSGNPLLKPQYNDNVSLTFRYNWLMLMANYTYTDGKIIDECHQYKKESSITLLHKVNSLSALHKLQTFVVAAPHFGVFHPNLMVGIIAQNFRVYESENIQRFNKPMLIARWNNMLQLKRGYLLNLDFNWHSSNDSENIRAGHSWSINSGLSKQFGRHWNAKITVNDIFNSAKNNHFIIYSGSNKLEMTKCVTSRYFGCTIRYNFNTTKSKYVGKGAGETEKKRL